MVVYRKTLAAGLVLALGTTAAVSQSPLPAPIDGAWPSDAPAPASPPMRVTSDTAEYCDSLAGRVARQQQLHPTAEPNVRQLADEGHHMCDRGLIRGGLARLRRALLLLRQSEKDRAEK